jgi:hypothetical protein
MIALVGHFVHRMGWMICLFFICFFILFKPIFYHIQSFLAIDLWPFLFIAIFPPTLTSILPTHLATLVT